MSDKTLIIAQIYGTVGGLMAAPVLNTIHIERLAETAIVTVISATISFALPVLYRLACKKYKIGTDGLKKNELRLN